VTETIRPYITSSKNNIISSKMRKEIIEWLREPSYDDVSLTNVEFCRYSWNYYNEYNINKNIKRFNNYHNLNTVVLNKINTEYGDLEIITNKPKFKKVNLDNNEYTSIGDGIWRDLEFNEVDDQLSDLFNEKTK
jgi:hypothetical protein